MEIKSFHQNQRVRVLRNASGLPVGAVGTVTRVRVSDNGAFIALDQLHQNPTVHPFPTDDPRATHVLAYPEDCEMPATTASIIVPPTETRTDAELVEWQRAEWRKLVGG